MKPYSGIPYPIQNSNLSAATDTYAHSCFMVPMKEQRVCKANSRAERGCVATSSLYARVRILAERFCIIGNSEEFPIIQKKSARFHLLVRADTFLFTTYFYNGAARSFDIITGNYYTANIIILWNFVHNVKHKFLYNSAKCSGTGVLF